MLIHPLLCVGVRLNQELCSPLLFSHSKNLSLGEVARMSIRLVNKSSSVLCTSFLLVEPHSSPELHEKDSTSKMLHSGNLVTFVPQASVQAYACDSHMTIINLSCHVMIIMQLVLHQLLNRIALLTLIMIEVPFSHALITGLMFCSHGNA